MTTISLRENNSYLGLVIKLLVHNIFLLFTLLLYLYNVNVNLKHEINFQNGNLRKATILNTDLKDKLYKVTDITFLKSLVSGRNLIEERNPYYFKEGSLLWVAVR